MPSENVSRNGPHLLRVETDNERGNVDDLLSDTDVPLADQDTGVVDRLGESRLEDLGLEATLEEVLDLEREDVIETHAGLVEDTDTNKTTDQGVTLTGEIVCSVALGLTDEGFIETHLEETLGVLLVELEELTSGTTDLGEGERDAPDLVLVLETEFSSKLELGIETSGLVGATRDLSGGNKKRTSGVNSSLVGW